MSDEPRITVELTLTEARALTRAANFLLWLCRSSFGDQLDEAESASRPLQDAAIKVEVEALTCEGAL